MLSGWEVKSLREGKVQLTDSYVLMKDGEAFLLGSQITPLNTASTHFVTDPTRTRKLLLNKRELARILVATAAKGQTCVCTQALCQNRPHSISNGLIVCGFSVFGASAGQRSELH